MGISLETFASRLGVSKMLISYIENGERSLTDAQERKIREVFNLTNEDVMKLKCYGDLTRLYSDEYRPRV